MIRFHALGGLSVSDNGDEMSVGGQRQRRLLAMLLIHRNAVVSVDRLAEAVFAGAPTAAASTTLRSYVARVRKVIDANGSAPTVVTQAPGYVLRLPGEAFDVACFERLVDDAGSSLARGDAAGASPVLREALGLWRGDAYAEFAEEDWVRPEAQRLEELRIVAAERLVEAQLACGRTVQTIPEIERLVGEHELREGFRAQLMVALYRAGRHADALAVYRDYRHVLVEELGLEPSPGLVELQRRVLDHDPTLLLSEPAGVPLRGYRLGERLGTGRDGVVFAAHLPGVGRDVVVRVYRGEIADRPEFVRSFEGRAHRLASLRHPAVVTIHDYWREPGGAYLVMRRMHGGTLADRLARGPLTNAEVATLVGRIGGALTAAGEHGIVHGAVTADSVLFDNAGDPFLSDFALGSAKWGDDLHDFVVMVMACLPDDRGAAAELLTRGLATVGRPAMADLVAKLLVVLSGTESATYVERSNPYKGLRAFDEADAADFFGRAALVDEILARLGRVDLHGRLVLVVGGSGCGKSSVVRAGLLPRVRCGDVPGSQSWFLATMLPGSSPFKELAESLRHVAITDITRLADHLAEDGGIDRVLRRLLPADGQLLLVVDQFEELFTLADERDQRAFLDGLVHAVAAPDSRLRVVATLRADFYDRPLAVQRFGSVVHEATVTIAAMSPGELEAAVVEPAERVGGGVERALVAELVAAVADEPAALPSLQFTLFELAERSPDTRLTLAAYRVLGGVAGAVASRAELLYSGLDDDERATVRQMFDRLVVVGADGEPTRRRATRAELAGRAADVAMDAVIDRWAQARLLTLDRHPQSRLPTVELAHEALLRDWPRLRDWIAEDRDALMVLGRVREAAGTWLELDRDLGALYRGASLEVALDVAGGRAGALPAVEREFLDASRDERDREQRDEAAHVARQARANRRLRVQVAIIGVALVVALAGGFTALDQRRDAQQERRVATARELAAAADANIADDPERSMLLALAAIDETRSSDGTVLPEAEGALHRAVSASRVVLSVPGVGGGLDWSPDGTTFVTEGPEESGSIDVRDAGTGESLRSWRGHDIDVNDVAFSSDGSMLATVGDDGALRVWDPATGEQLLEHQTSGSVFGPSFSADGSQVAAAWSEELMVRVLDVASGETEAEIAGVGFAVSTDFSPDGERLVIGGYDGPVATVVDASSGDPLLTLSGANGGTNDVGWSPDGRWIAAAGVDEAVGVWDAESGSHQFAVSGHTAPVNRLDWSPDAARLATAADDGTARISEITDAGTRELLTFSAQGTLHALAGVAFSPDGEQLMTGDRAVTGVTVWDASATGGGEWANVQGLAYGAADFTPDGHGLVVHQGESGLSITDVETGAARGTIDARAGGEPEVGWLDVSSDGLVAATTDRGSIDIWDVSTAQHRFAVPVANDEVWGLDWSRDGDLLAVAVNSSDDGGHVRILDDSGVELARVAEAPGHFVESASFSPDGRLLATTRHGMERVNPTNMVATIWDWERGVALATMGVSTRRVVFDATGERIATARLVEGLADIWDARTGDKLVTIAAPTEIVDITYSPDGTSVATGHADGTVRLWDPETGVERLVLHGDGGRVGDVVFSPDGSTLASAGHNDGIVRVWALDLDDLIAIANTRLTRMLSDAECRQYLHVERCSAS